MRAKSIAADILSDAAGSIFSSAGIYIFASRGGFAMGGVSGASLLVNRLTGISAGTAVFLLNIPLVVISFKLVGRRFLLRSLRPMIMTTLLLDFLFPRFPVYEGSKLLSALYSGVFIGIGLALLYMRGSSTGGTDFLMMAIRRYKPHLSAGFVMMSIDLVIITLGWPVFGSVDAVLYGLVSTFVTSVTVDRIMYRAGAGKLMLIVTEKPDETAAKISEVCDRGSTVIDAVGSYTGSRKGIVMCACSNSQVYGIKKAAAAIDGKAFMMIADAGEVYGEGFSER